MVSRGMMIRASTVNIQMGWIYMILPASFLAMALVGVELLLRSITGLFAPEAEHAALPTIDLEHAGEG
jgi:TRAP-type C4-dicarboxylate transport system permease small subunit